MVTGGLARDGGSRMKSLTCLIVGAISVGAIEMTWPCISCCNRLVLVCYLAVVIGFPSIAKEKANASAHASFKPLLAIVPLAIANHTGGD